MSTGRWGLDEPGAGAGQLEANSEYATLAVSGSATGGTWSATSVTLEPLAISGLILLGLVSRRGVDDDGAVAAPDEAKVPPRRRRAPACLRAGCWLPACLVATRLLACMVLYACSVCLPGGRPLLPACLVVDCLARATRRMQVAVWIRAATKRFAWKKRRLQKKVK